MTFKFFTIFIAFAFLLAVSRCDNENDAGGSPEVDTNFDFVQGDSSRIPPRPKSPGEDGPGGGMKLSVRTVLLDGIGYYVFHPICQSGQFANKLAKPFCQSQIAQPICKWDKQSENLFKYCFLSVKHIPCYLTPYFYSN